MWSARISRSAFILLNVAAYLTLLTVAVPTLLQLPGWARLWVGALLFLFGLLVSFFHRFKKDGLSPHLYLSAQSTIIVIVMLRFPGVGLSQVHLLFFVLSAYAMLMLPVATAAVWIVGFFLFTMGVAGFTFGWSHALGMSAVAGGHALFGGFGALLRQAEEDRRQTEQLLEELREAHEQLQAYAAQAEQLAVAEERNRLAREMHDALGHRLTVAVVQLEGAQRLIASEPARAAQIVGTMREQVKAALSDLRQTVAALRTTSTYGEPRAGGAPEDLPLPAALARLTKSFSEATGLAVQLALPPGMPDLPAAQRLALFRTAQEGLTNVQRHSGARRAWVTVETDEGRVRLSVEDDGRGFPDRVIEGDVGLRGLRERAAELDGELRVENRGAGGAHSAAHSGARIVMDLPRHAERVDAHDAA